ncbi:hypothetical protein DES36_11458 [Alkalibaculum bacchi]|jgi:hypothetical protein|uniref:DUF2292 domain-containing protein n=1 Tax=Alkalibaculum bacchi TaxID=645887 RepID=A0A366I211_9FIRM|nr:YezD family protein [Alkalibaculum bacchi]RBP61375.1 hypothetical protein DES36_11458 [Alkalibaculum bacchi]
MDRSQKKLIDNFTDETLRKILELKKSIKYGSITLIIQDGFVVQIEANEKIRMK